MTSGPRERGSPETEAVPVTVFVSIGTNVAPEHHVGIALRELRQRFGPLRASGVYRNAPEGFEGPDFLNLVVSFETTEPPRAVLEALESLHAKAGRVRGASAFASRTLDLDLLLYGERIIPELRIPRPEIATYSFVLGPLAELAPALCHPVTGETMADLWARFDRGRHPLQRVEL